MKTLTGILLLTSLSITPAVRAENGVNLQTLMETGDCISCDLPKN
ncbi:MAG: hypothetical protein AB4063_10340 [Crocosphaera sp.]